MNKKTLIAVGAIIVTFAILQTLISGETLNTYWAQILQQSLVITISSVGLSLIYGFTGQFSLGHAAFYGIGAYTAAFITKSMGGGEIWFPIALIAGAVVAGLVGLLIGLPILRLKSDYLGIATLGFGIIVTVLMNNSDKLSSMFGGARGMLAIPHLTNFAWVFFATVVVVFLSRNFILSSFGRACTSIREDEVAADIMGLNTTKFKTMAFTLGCALAGLAGGLYAHLYLYLNPSSFDFLKSLDVLLVVVLGGLGSLTGTVVTAVVWVFLQEVLRAVLPPDYLDWRGVIYALVLIVVMIERPLGLMGGKEFSLDRFFKNKAGHAPGKGADDRASA